MFSKLLVLFIVVPAVELYLLIQLGNMIGVIETLGIIVLTGIVGSYLAKTQGVSAWKRFHNRLASGQLPGNELIDGVIILVSAAFLLTPGIITDLVGVLGLFPPTRAIIRRYFVPRLVASFSGIMAFGAAYRGTSAAGSSSYRYDAATTANNGNRWQRDLSGPNSYSTPDSGPDFLVRDDSDPEITIGGHAKRKPGTDTDSESVN